METYDRWHGLDWPKNVPVHQRHLKLWKHWREYPQANFLSPISEHVLEACRILFTKDQLTIHPWMVEQAESWTMDKFTIWWGCAGSGKSHSLGIFSLLDYITDPDCTFTLLASTTKSMLEVRSFSSVVQYLTYLKANRQFNVPFKFLRQRMEVVPEAASEEDLPNLKHKIVGVAVQQGTTEEARSNLQGVHTKYVRLILDELSGMRPAAMEARHNLIQCFDFKLVGACNPESLYDQAGTYSVPKDPGGWNSVGLDSTKWDTPYGTVRRFDAFKSPALKAPEKYPFLPTAAIIARMIEQNNGNEDAPAVWTFLRAFPAPQADERTVITETMVKSYNMMDVVKWKQKYIRVAGFDPAFTSDGDLPILVTVDVGYDERGINTLCRDQTYKLVIKASDAKPALEQLVDQVVRLMDINGIALRHLGVDDSGVQSVADAIISRYGAPGLYRCNFAARAPDVAVSSTNAMLASEKYRNMVTWMYFLVYEYGQRGQIRGLSVDIVRQLCHRRILPKLRPSQLESKKDYKKRTKQPSPDEADAFVIAVAVARTVLGVLPGAAEWQMAESFGGSSGWDRAAVDRYNNLPTSYGVGSSIL